MNETESGPWFWLGFFIALFCLLAYLGVIGP